jgi:hypothetical protein
MSEEEKDPTPVIEGAEVTPEQTQRESPLIGTSAALFADMFDDIEEAPTPVVEDKKEEPVLEAEKPQEPKRKVYKLSDFTEDDMIEVKVDGKIITLPASEAFKDVQLAKNLYLKHDEFAAQKKVWEETNLKAKESSQAKMPEIPKVTEENQYIVDAVGPLIQGLQSEIVNLKSQLAYHNQTLGAITEETRPVRYQAAVEEINAKLQKEGYDDFKKYLPKVEDFIFDKKQEGVEEFEKWNNKSGFEMAYKELKLNDLNKEIKASLTKDNSPAKTERPKPKLVPKVEGGGGSPTQTDEEAATYNKLLKEAQQTGDWMKVLDFKGAIK